MRIAFITAPERGLTDRILSDVAAAMAADGLRLAGGVQTNSDCEARSHCDMDLRVLPDGQVVRISQNLGDEARGCRLDAGALEQAVGLAEAALAAGPVDLVIINKFGKHESEGRGFRGLLAEAVAEDIPALIGVSRQSLPAFEVFTGGLAAPLPAERDAVLNWCREQAAHFAR